MLMSSHCLFLAFSKQSWAWFHLCLKTNLTRCNIEEHSGSYWFGSKLSPCCLCFAFPISPWMCWLLIHWAWFARPYGPWELLLHGATCAERLPGLSQGEAEAAEEGKRVPAVLSSWEKSCSPKPVLWTALACGHCDNPRRSCRAASSRSLPDLWESEITNPAWIF